MPWKNCHKKPTRLSRKLWRAIKEYRGFEIRGGPENVFISRYYFGTSYFERLQWTLHYVDTGTETGYGSQWSVKRCLEDHTCIQEE